MSDQESRTKKIIKELSAKIDELLEQSNISKGDVKKEIDARIKELKKSRDQVNEEFKKIREENKETFDKVEKLAKNTFKEVKSVLSDFWDRISEDKKEEDSEKGTKKEE